MEEIINPVNPIDFVGRSEQVDAFYQWIKDLVSDQPIMRWVHISGVAGAGKTSLMNKLKDIALSQDILTFSIEMPIAPEGLKNFFNGIKEQINFLSPEWRNFLERKRGLGIGDVPEEILERALGETIDEQTLNEFIDAFFLRLDRADLKLKEDRKFIGIFIDDLDRVMNYEFLSVFEILKAIFRETNRRNLNIFFLTAGHSSINQHLNLKEMEQQSMVLHLEVSNFDFTDADLMIRRRGKLIKTEREKVLSASTRLPFDLALRQFLAAKGIDQTKLDAETVANAWGLSEEEVQLLEDLSKKDINLFERTEILKHHDEEILNSFVQNFLLTRSGNHYSFITRSIWELISSIFLPIDPRTEVLLLLNRIERLASKGLLPPKEDIEIIQGNVKRVHDPLLIFRLSTELAKTGEVALENGLRDLTLELLEIAAEGLLKTGDYERLGDLYERLAKGFAEKQHDYFSALAYEESAKYFAKAKIEWRSQANFREAGRRYRREISNMDIENFHYAARSLFQKAIQAFQLAGKKNTAKEIQDQAVTTFVKYPQHQKYFKNLTIQ